MSGLSGLIIEDNKCSLVLRSSSLFVNINGFVASTLARLCYFNQFDHEAEAVFVYNDNETFITDFRATIGQRKVHRQVRDLLSEKEADRFCAHDQTDLVISIGKIPPNALVLLEVDVLGELQTTDNGQALVFKTPETFTPFYSEFSEEGSTTQAYKFDIKIKSDMSCQLAGCHSPSHAIQVDADADAMTAETLIITLAEEFRYDRQIKVCFYPARPLDVYTSIEPGLGPLQEINSSRKNARYSTLSANPQIDSFLRNEILNPKAKEQHKDVIISDSITQQLVKDFPTRAINKNIFLKRRSSDYLVSDSKTRDETCINEHSNKENQKHSQKDDVARSLENAASVTRCVVENYNLNSRGINHARSRNFFSDSIIAASFLADLSNYSVCGEYIFMLDRSGSMNGSHICNARESLVLFLKSLPTSSYFNVVSFGSYSRSLFPCSQRYTQDSLEKGCVYVNSIRADMGGSELLQPLKAVLEKPHKAGYARNVFVLTDGDIAQPDAILRYLKTKCHKARIFTFGIGPKISYNTVCNIARSAQGKAYFSEPGSKVQTKVIQCLKEVLKPTLCEVKVDWQLPSNWQLLRATPEIPFSVSDQRINLYASVQLPSRAQKQSRLGEKRKPSSVKEFWFDEELDSCQLGDNIFFEDFQDNGEFSGYWGTDTDISTSDCEQQYDEKVGSDREYDVGSDRNDIVPHLVGDGIMDGDNEELNLEKPGEIFETSKKIRTDKSNAEDIVKNWREVRNIRLYSSDTSTETEDEGQPDYGNQSNILESHYSNRLDILNGNMSPPEKDLSQRNYDLNHNHYLIDSVTTFRGMETSDDVINKLAYVTDMNIGDSSAKKEDIMGNNIDVSTGKTCISPFDASADDSSHLSNNVRYDDVIYNDVIHNDVKSVYITDNGKQANRIRQNEVYVSKRSCDVSSIDMNSTGCIIEQNSKENVIDCDNSENIPCNNNKIDDGIKESTELIKDKTDSDWGSVLITGYIGLDIHREIIRLCLSTNTSNSISLHQMAAKKFIDGMEAILDSTPDSSGMEREIVDLSKESRVPSSMTSSMTIDDTGNIIGVFQDSLGLNLRRRKQLHRNSPKQTTREDNPPAILVSCPSVDEESRSPTKRRLGMSTEVDPISDDGKYYRIERLDPEGCDQVKRETRRKRLVECRNIPVKAIHRRKLVSTRLTLLSRKMRNAHKLNVFAGPPFIRLILLQSAEGFWQLSYAFARIIGLPLVQLELAAPFVDSTMIPLAEQDDRLGIDCYYDSLALWATALAVVYLKRKWTSHEEDWELIAIKAEAWLQRQTFPQGFGYIDVMLAAKQAIVLLEQKYRSRAKSEPVGLID